jgi:SAM-dependent methyltransferase
MSNDRYFLPPTYVSRPNPDYFVDEDLNAVWQPDVYPETAVVARRVGASTVVDVGCGTAAKLVALHPEFEIVGIDYGPNIEFCRAHYDVGTWIDVDLDQADSLGYTGFEAAVVVCADVIEHLLHPDRLLTLLRTALDGGARALLLSTPERDLYNEPGHLGPPPNTAHVHEWAMPELRSFMAAHRLDGHFGLTRSNDVMPYMQTILAVVPGDADEHRRVVAEWWEDRRKWEQLAVEQDRLLAEKERVIQEFDEAKQWLEEQRVAWQKTAETALQAQATAEEQLAILTEQARTEHR